MKISTILGVFIITLTAACDPPPEFVASLSDPGEAKYDQRVLGQWYQQADSPLVYAAIGDDPTVSPVAVEEGGTVVQQDENAGTRLQISLVFQDAGGEDAASLPLTGHASRVDGALYYDFVRRQTPYAYDYTAPGEKPGHIIVRMFHPTPDTILACGLFLGDYESGDEEAFAGTGLSPRFADVATRINGRPVDPTDTLVHTLVEGSREDLRRLVSRDPGADFLFMFSFTRLGTPWVNPEDDPGLQAYMQAHKDECDFSSVN